MAQQMIDGQKAGSGSARQPVIAPDSASSVTKLKMAVGLSEGEIEGFTRADVKLDGTPLTELSSDIVCDYRFGTNDQEYIPGIDEVANEIGVGVELRGDTDWVKLITNQDIDHVGIRLRWGPLQTSHSNGDITGVSITYEIYIAPVGGSYERVLSTTLSDKTSDSYERYHEFKLPESDSGWMVRVVRVTPSAQSSLVSDKMFVQAYSEIIKSKFTFPYTSLVYLEYDAKTFSNVAKVAVNAKGLIIKVPSNYDPVTRQYSGLWSGTFKMAYTNNPAWVYYDLVTNPRYGCGDRIDSSMVDKWSLYRLGQYCDQMVDDGYGGLEPRFTCNVYLQSKERAYDILNRLTGLFRAINFWNGSQLVVDADIPQDTSYLYTNANVVDGLFEYAGTAATDLYSAAKVAWDNPANGYNTEYEAVSYEHLVKKLGFKTLELDAWGCTSRGQALRAGRWALLAESDTVTFKVGMDGYLAMPGKIIEIQDEFYAGKSNGGRVISIDQSRKVITLDRPVTTISGDTISFNTALDGIKKYNIISSAGSVVTVSESIDPSIENMHIWAINSSQLATQKYRILTVKYDGVGEFTISAVEYNPNKYEEIDSNIKFDEPPTSVINPVVQAAVQNVVITPSDFIYQGLNSVNLEIKWDRAENAVEYLVELKKDDGSWLKLPVTGNNSITLENVYAGAYIARVIAVSAFELKSLPAYSIKTTISGKQSAPQPPTNLRSVSIMFGAEFYWDFPPNSSDTAVSRIAVSYVDPAFDVDESTLVIYDKAYSDNKLVIQNLDVGSPVWVKVKLIDKLGFESAYTGWVSATASADASAVLDILSGKLTETQLSQSLVEKIENSDLENNQAFIDVQQKIEGLDAQYYLRIQSGKYVSGFGLGVDGGRSDFIVHSDSFALGNPAGGDEVVSYPFIFRTTAYTDPNTGTVFPVGAYMKSAFIDYASIDTAHIKQLAVKSAQIGDGQITTAKIGDLQVDTLKIKDNAVTVPAATTLSTKIQRTTTRQPTTFAGGLAALVDSSNYFGDILSLTINRSGGKCRIEGSIWMDKIYGTLYTDTGAIVSKDEQYVGVLVYRNGTLISWARVPVSYKDTNQVREYSGVAAIPVVIDDAFTGSATYSIRLGISSDRTTTGTQMAVFSQYPTIVSATLAVMELKK